MGRVEVGGRGRGMARAEVGWGKHCSCLYFLECCSGLSIRRGRLFRLVVSLDSLEGVGEVDGEAEDGAAVQVVVILMILLHRTRGRDTRPNRKVGDLDSGQVQLLARLEVIWLEVEETDNRKRREVIHGLEGTVVVGTTVHRQHEAALVQVHLQDTRVQDSAQHQEDRQAEKFMACLIDRSPWYI